MQVQLPYMLSAGFATQLPAKPGGGVKEEAPNKVLYPILMTQDDFETEISHV